MCLALLVAVTGCMMPNRDKQVAENEKRLAADGIIALETGQVAPPFTARATDGSELSVPAGLDGRKLMLFFYPADDTPNTTRQLKSLMKFNEQLSAAGITVYAVSGGGLAKHQSYIDKYTLTVPLIADPGLQIAQRYGCAAADGEFVQRTLVGIDAEGKIAFFERGFPLTNNADPVLEWFANAGGTPVAADGGEEADGAEVTANLDSLDEPARRAVYLEIMLAREQAWAEAEAQYPLDTEGVDQREQVRHQGELAIELENQYLDNIAAAHELTLLDLTAIEAEGEAAGWPDADGAAEDAESGAEDGGTEATE